MLLNIFLRTEPVFIGEYGLPQILRRWWPLVLMQYCCSFNTDPFHFYLAVLIAVPSFNPAVLQSQLHSVLHIATVLHSYLIFKRWWRLQQFQSPQRCLCNTSI